MNTIKSWIDTNEMHKFCQICRKETNAPCCYSMGCPLKLFSQAVYLASSKNLTIREASKLTLRREK